VEFVKANGNRVPSRKQLRNAGVIPNWSGSGGRGGDKSPRSPRGQTQGRANTANMGRSTAAKAKVDQSRSVIVFEGKKHGHQVAVLDRKDVLMEGASYVSAASRTPTPPGARQLV